MIPSASRVRLVVPTVLVAALAGCGAEERAKLQADLVAAQHERESLSQKLAEVQDSGRRQSDEFAAFRKKAESDTAEAQTRAAKAESDAAKAESESAEKLKALRHDEEAKKKDFERVTEHRDELKEWIEKELLPIAEEHDPRLVNLRQSALEMAAEVEKVRALKFKQPFMRRLLDRKEMGAWMRRDAKKEMPPEKVKKEVAVNAAFGFCKPDIDMLELFGQLAETGVAAFYKAETGTFYLVSGNDGRGARPIVFHELVHAVEDQYFDLTTLQKSAEDDNDRSIAIKGLIEGSAAYHQSLYEKANPEDLKAMVKAQMTPETVRSQLKMISDVPPALVAIMGLYPYNNAKSWVAAMNPDAATMERLFQDPPVSSEQVLHPAKFPLDGNRDYPHIVETPSVESVLGQGWERVDDNNMGELLTGVLLAQLQVGGRYAPAFMAILDQKTGGVAFKKDAKTASEGWDGDRYTAWTEKDGGAVTIVWTSVWDSDADAKEFHDTYGDLLGKRVLGKAFTARPEVVRYVDPVTGRVSGLDIAGTKVVAVIAAPADKADALFAAGAAAKVTADPRDAGDK